jgi:uncharacterized protein
VGLLAVDASTARRFILGQQGLWPGRRWRGPEGLRLAVRQIGSVQVDPVSVVGHSQDLALLSRVHRYRPEHLERALYVERSLFEWGGNLQIRPIEELPYLLPKIRTTDYLGRRARFENTHRELVARVLREVEARGPIGSRDLSGGETVSSYRARRDTGLALYYLWLRGDLMISGREAGERRYDLIERLVPRRFLAGPSKSAAERRRFRQGMRLYGLPNSSELYAIQRMSSIGPTTARDRGSWVKHLENEGRLLRVKVDGWRGTYWVDAEDAPGLECLREGGTPRAWAPLSSCSEDEVAFLAPLEIVSARGRSERLFGFRYVWEVYKPPAKRQWGYYVLPMLFRDRLVGRIEPSIDPSTGAVHVAQVWWEADVEPSPLVAPVARGLRRMVDYLGVPGATLGRLTPPSFRNALANEIRHWTP